MADNIPQTLYHTTLTVVDYHADTSGSTRTVFVLGTHTDLAVAKAFSLKALEKLGYDKTDFEIYEARPDVAEWTHGDGMLVYTKAPAGQEFLVGIDTKPNTENLPENPDESSTLLLPPGAHHLHYVLQTKIDYAKDDVGAAQSTEVQGTYVKRSDAIAAAKTVLIDDEIQKSDFAQWDEWDGDKTPDDWPFGEDVIVHAVSQTGENYLVAVRTVPGAHHRHGKKN